MKRGERTRMMSARLENPSLPGPSAGSTLSLIDGDYLL